MTKFLLIRHSLTDAVGRRLSGRTPGVSLNAEGREQAERLARRLAGARLDAIYCSPMERAVETAAPLAKISGIPSTICEDFTEMDFGEWTNRSISELEPDPQFRLFNMFRSVTPIPGGETMAAAQLRMVAGIQKLKGLHPDKTVVIVSHADLIKAAVAYYAGIPLDLFQRIEISPASISILELYDETARVTLLNDAGNGF